MKTEAAALDLGADPLTGRVATLLETAFPFAELSQVARADRRGRDPVYGAHRWWARRPRSLIRGILLASGMPESEGLTAFWEAYSGDGAPLEGLRVHDIFLGGGSTLVEGARLGAEPSGSDVDPLAVEIVRQSLVAASGEGVQRVAQALLEQLREEFGHLYPSVRDGWTPLHYFYVRRVGCPSCDNRGLLYRDLVIARDVEKVGAVVRDAEVTAFCPSCLAVHQVDREATSLLCCGSEHHLDSGTFTNQKYTCPSCGCRTDHAGLQTGTAELVLIAVEETHPQQRRAVRGPMDGEADIGSAARQLLDSDPDRFLLPTAEFSEPRSDPRPVSYGIRSARELFSPRQQAVLGRAFRLIDGWDASPEVRRAVRLGLSNALTTNNMLCGYATDYGRLSPLFGVRSYCIPALSVELNPLQGEGGRGTLHRCLGRAVRSSAGEVSRFVWDPELGEPKRIVLRDRARSSADTSQVVCRPASTVSLQLAGTVDICFFDPPYFNYIPYDELSEFYRAWMPVSELAGAPALPTGPDPVEVFARSLADAMRSAMSALKPGRPFSFTYHSTDQDAWDAVGRAVDLAGVTITALWPLYSDGHMGHHSHPGNCEWDILVVCRPSHTCEGNRPKGWSKDAWIQAVAPIEVGDSDQTNMQMAINMASSRSGIPLCQEQE